MPRFVGLRYANPTYEIATKLRFVGLRCANPTYETHHPLFGAKAVEFFLHRFRRMDGHGKKAIFHRFFFLDVREARRA